MNLFSNLKTLRKNYTISQEEISEKLNVSRQTISKWENGQSEPSIDMIVLIAEVFNVTLDDLICNEIAPKVFSLSKVQKTDDLNEVIEVNENENIYFPRVGIDNLDAYQLFKKAYELDLKLEKAGDKSLLGDIMSLYLEAFDRGIIEAAVNMLRILTKAQMKAKVGEPDEKFPLQHRVEFFMNSLEDENHPAGSFYRAIHLIYRLADNGKTDDENWDDGLIMMYEMANEGNEYAIQYIELIESAKTE